MASLAGMASDPTREGYPAKAQGQAALRTGAVTVRSAKSRPLTTRAGIRRARRFARSRQGVVAFAVLDSEHRPRGLRRTTPFPSASVSKAMLLVAALRRAGGRRLGDTTRRLLRSMITVSDNDAASAVYAQVGGEGLRRVARRRRDEEVHRRGALGRRPGHGCRPGATSSFASTSSCPPAHRRYARKLLSSIVTSQRWGIARAARREHVKVFFKGGWRNGITHQVALLERGGRRLALAVLTSGSPSIAYAEETIERIASRVLD